MFSIQLESGRFGWDPPTKPSDRHSAIITEWLKTPDFETVKLHRGEWAFFGCWENRGKIKYAGHDSQVGTNLGKLMYPFTDYKILKFLDVLSQFEYAKQRLQESEMVNLLPSNRDSVGKFKPKSIHEVWSDFDFGQKEKPSKWIVFVALRIVKRIYE